MPFGQSFALCQAGIVVVDDGLALVDAFRPDTRLGDGVMDVCFVRLAKVFNGIGGPALERHGLEIGIDEMEKTDSAVGQGFRLIQGCLQQVIQDQAVRGPQQPQSRGHHRFDVLALGYVPNSHEETLLASQGQRAGGDLDRKDRAVFFFVQMAGDDQYAVWFGQCFADKPARAVFIGGKVPAWHVGQFFHRIVVQFQGPGAGVHDPSGLAVNDQERIRGQFKQVSILLFTFEQGHFQFNLVPTEFVQSLLGLFRRHRGQAGGCSGRKFFCRVFGLSA